MPTLIKQAEGVGQVRLVDFKFHQRLERLLTHICLNLLSVLINRIQLKRQLVGRIGLLRQQAFNPSGHVIQATCRVKPGTDTKSQV